MSAAPASPTPTPTPIEACELNPEFFGVELSLVCAALDLLVISAEGIVVEAELVLPVVLLVTVDEVVSRTVEDEVVLISFPNRLTVPLVMLKYTVLAKLAVSSRRNSMKLN